MNRESHVGSWETFNLDIGLVPLGERRCLPLSPDDLKSTYDLHRRFNSAENMQANGFRQQKTEPPLNMREIAYQTYEKDPLGLIVVEDLQ